MVEKVSTELLDLFEALLRSQLNTLRQLRKASGLEDKPDQSEHRMSQMDMVFDILAIANQPLHVNDLLVAIKDRFGVELDKESVVSALVKRVKRQDRFTKTAPNTFALIAQDPGGGRR